MGSDRETEKAAFLAAAPVWSVIVITLDVFVIYAIAMHGKELKSGTL